MNEAEKLERIAELFGGGCALARAVSMHPSGITRRIKGEIRITSRDWTCVEAAVTKRMDELWEAVTEAEES